MEQLSLSSIESAGTASLIKTTANPETVSAEKFQAYLAEQSDQSGKKSSEKALDSKAKIISDKGEEELSEDSAEADAAAFFYGFMSSVQEQETSGSAVESLPEAELSKLETPDYIEPATLMSPTDRITLDDLSEKPAVPLSNDGSTAETRDNQPIGNSVEKKLAAVQNEWPIIIPEEEPVSIKENEHSSNAAVQADASETAETMIAEILPTSRLLTKDWAQTAKSALTIEQSAIESNESIDPAEKLNELPQSKINEINNGETNLIDKSGKEPSVLMGVSVEKEPAAKSSEDSNPKSELAGSAIVRGNTAETVGKAMESPKMIRQQVTQAVNEVITKTVETFQNGKHSAAKVSISPSSMGEITITLEMVDNVLSTKIMVESLKTQELLTGGVPKLSDNLNRQQIQLGEVTIQVTTNGETGSQFNERQQERNRPTSRLSNPVSVVEGPVTEPDEGQSGSRSGRLSILV